MNEKPKEWIYRGPAEVRQIETRTTTKGTPYQALEVKLPDGEILKTSIFDSAIWDSFGGLICDPGEFVYIELYRDERDPKYNRVASMRPATDDERSRYFDEMTSDRARTSSVPESNKISRGPDEFEERAARMAAVKAAAHLVGGSGNPSSVETLFYDISDAITKYILTGERSDKMRDISSDMKEVGE